MGIMEDNNFQLTSVVLSGSLLHLPSHLLHEGNPPLHLHLHLPPLHLPPIQPLCRQGAVMEGPSCDLKSSSDDKIICPSKPQLWFVLLCFQKEQQDGRAISRLFGDRENQLAEQLQHQ